MNEIENLLAENKQLRAELTLHKEIVARIGEDLYAFRESCEEPDDYYDAAGELLDWLEPIWKPKSSAQWKVERSTSLKEIIAQAEKVAQLPGLGNIKFTLEEMLCSMRAELQQFESPAEGITTP